MRGSGELWECGEVMVSKGHRKLGLISWYLLAVLWTESDKEMPVVVKWPVLMTSAFHLRLRHGLGLFCIFFKSYIHCLIGPLTVVGLHSIPFFPPLFPNFSPSIQLPHGFAQLIPPERDCHHISPFSGRQQSRKNWGGGGLDSDPGSATASWAGVLPALLPFWAGWH